MPRVLSRHSTCADAQARSPASRRQDQGAAVPHSQPSTGRSPVGFWVRPHAPIASFQPSSRACVPPPRPPYSSAAVLAAPIASFQPSSRACVPPPRPPYSRAVVFAVPIVFVSAVEPCLCSSASTPLFTCRGICCSDRFVSAVEPCLRCSASTPLFPCRGTCCSDRFVSAVEPCLWCAASTPSFPCGGTCLWRGAENASVQPSAAIAEASSQTRACRRDRASHRRLAVSAFARHRAAMQTMQTSEAGMVSVLPPSTTSSLT